MDEFAYKSYINAGRILKEAREETRHMIKPGALLLEVAEKIEGIIKEKGAHPAFPANLSIDDTAAHYTPTPDDKTVFGENDTVKIDTGVQVNGYIADSSYTMCFDTDKKEMVTVINAALKNALKLATPERKISEISEAIESTITSAGFRPVSNLTGHQLERYRLHTGVTIPNVKTHSKQVLKEGDVVAIEPFLTDGGGAVKESRDVMIYMFEKQKPVRMNAARQILALSKSRFFSLPFATRWIKRPQGIMLAQALKELVSTGALYSYNVLKEVNGGIVTQAEHTVIVKDKPIITTA